jgi:HB1/ASXL restriction endonuclease-like protein with HTH domain
MPASFGKEPNVQNLGWKEAILEVLKSADAPMHYTDIADQIAKRELHELGATPANSVVAAITISLQREGAASPFTRVGGGIYALRDAPPRTGDDKVLSDAGEASPSTGLVNAYGMFWDRAKIYWAQTPKILGRQQALSTPVNFCEQRGVYLLHDLQGVVYVGRVTDQGLGKRMFQHTLDRLNSRWNRFSWFGVYPVREDGSLHTSTTFAHLNIDVVIATMEAVLIEGLEPRQNRKRGDDFQAVEFLQVEDPRLVQDRKVSVARELLESIQRSQLE